MNAQRKLFHAVLLLSGSMALLVTAALFPGCAAGGPSPLNLPSLDRPSASVPPAPGTLMGGWTGEAEEEEEEEGAEGSVPGTVLLYIPNRIFDALEIVRAGVNVGIGFGADARATWLAQAAFQNDTSVGLGFQGLRHLPVCARMGHSVVALGPIRTPSLGILDWPKNPYDIRVELFLFLAGAHAAVDLEAIFDFLAGILTFDPSHDDFIMGS